MTVAPLTGIAAMLQAAFPEAQSDEHKKILAALNETPKPAQIAFAVHVCRMIAEEAQVLDAERSSIGVVVLRGMIKKLSQWLFMPASIFGRPAGTSRDLAYVMSEVANGHLEVFEEVLEIAKRHGLPVIERLPQLYYSQVYWLAMGARVDRFHALLEEMRILCDQAGGMPDQWRDAIHRRLLGKTP